MPSYLPDKYGAEISTLLTAVRTSSTRALGGDAEALILQSAAGLFKKSTVVMTAGEPHWSGWVRRSPKARSSGLAGRSTCLRLHGAEQLFRKAYEDRYSVAPSYPRTKWHRRSA
jgi:hypothetical protein